jgi:uncharacterized protein YndB with AHSA1/START domain
MSVTSVVKDAERLTMTVTSQYDVTAERAWQLWDDPRQLERWWGPPTYPATVVDHDLRPGGSVSYVMTGPEGDKHAGWWRVRAVDAPHRLDFEDGFADDAGRPNPDLPVTTTQVRLVDDGGTGTVMTVESTFPTVEAMQTMVDMGMVEGITQAMAQIDALLA